MIRYKTQEAPRSREPIEVYAGRNLVESMTDSLALVEKLVDQWREHEIIAAGDVVPTVESMLGYSMPHTGPQRLVVDLVREAVDNADKQAGSDPAATAELTSRLTALTLRRMHCGQTAQVAATNTIVTLRRLRQQLYNNIRRPRREDIEAIIRASLRDDRMVNMVIEAYGLAGSNGRLFFESASIARPIVELRTGYCFDLVAPCMSTIGKSTWDGESCRVAIIDGYIESVAEIDRLLSGAFEEKSPLIIFARQFDNEVLSTAAINRRRGTMNVIPIVVPFDADSANVLKDLAVVCGGDVVSSLQGQMITSIDFKQLPIVDRVHVHSGACVIHNDSTKRDVDAHVNQLSTQATDPAQQLAAPFLTRRMRCLASRMVAVRLPQSDSRKVVAVDRTLRRVKSAITAGIIEHSKVLSMIADIGCDSQLATLLASWVTNIEGDCSPLQALDAAIVNAGAQARLLATTGAVLA